MIDAYAYGIDISEWQGDIDLEPYKDHFVIIRAGYWTVRDKQFINNVRKCANLGIPYGIYWFSESLTLDTVKDEAAAFLAAAADCSPDLGVWVDMELSEYKEEHGFNVSKYAGPIAAELCRYMEEAGYYTGVYCSKYWLKYVDPACAGYDHWIASWGSNNGHVNDDTRDLGTLLQYTSKLNGQSLDGDVCYVSLDHYDRSKPSGSFTMDHGMLIRCLAYLTLSGIFGNDQKRIECLGAVYDEVQTEVNRIYEH